MSAAGAVAVRWRATNPDHVHLVVSVDFSTDAGRTWRTVYVGENTGKILIPRTVLTGSSRERVRVRVNDGFDRVTTSSKPFNLAPAPPRVTILSPARAGTIRGGATILLSALALDDAGHRLSGTAVTWSASGKRLGSGAELFAKLPAGARSITVRVRDRAGLVTQLTFPKPKSPRHVTQRQ